MMKKAVLFGVLILIIVGIILVVSNLSDGEGITGNVAANTVSTLTIIVENESGGAVEDATIYQNEVSKGRTSKYGIGKGTKTIVLKEGENWIYVEKEDFAKMNPTSVQSSLKGPQYITFVLLDKKTNFVINVESKEGSKAADARVSLYKGNLTSAQDATPLEKYVQTDEKGVAMFERLDDGIYNLKISKEGFERGNVEQIINLSHHGEELEINVVLFPLPKLEINVKDENGNPLSQAEVTQYTKEGYDTPGSWPLFVQYTTDEGKIIFSNVEWEDYYVFVIKKEGYSAQTVEWVLTSETQNLNVMMQKS